MKRVSMKVFFPGLNGLRFFAALAVVVSHLEMTLRFKGILSYWFWIEPRMISNAFVTIREGGMRFFPYMVSLAGYCGVSFFFVLSGFLITYLLLVEHAQEGKISIKDFYIRRLLRIWPLYYLLVIVGFFILPNIRWFDVSGQTDFLVNNFWANFLCYFFMVPNLASSYMIWHVPNIGQLWSIGVEEQFYLFWPLIMPLFIRSRKWLFYFLVILVAIKAFVLFSPFFSSGFTRFLGSLKFEAMAIGAVGAFALFYRKEWLQRFVFTPFVELGAYISVLLVLLFLPYSIFESLYLVLSVPFIVIILNVSCNPKSWFKLENKVFNYLGRISYGIYMYHFLVVTFVVNFLTETMHLSGFLYPWQRILIYVVSIGITLILSALSYTYFEKRFIRLKSGYTRVVSGEEAKELK